MRKSKKNKKRTIDLSVLNFHTGDDGRTFRITKAVIKDGVCNYSYEITSGQGAGDTHEVKGSGLIKESLAEAFDTLRVHLANLDDAFRRSGIEIEDINDHSTSEIAMDYFVEGVLIKGGHSDESLIIAGTKFSATAHGRIGIQTPKIALDNLSSYKFYMELKKAADEVRNEVALYKGGNYTVIRDEEDDEVNPNQLTISSSIESETSVNEPDFEDAKL